MKKVIYTIMLLGLLLAMNSCDNDDSDTNNDIDVITPNEDTNETSTLKIPIRRYA